MQIIDKMFASFVYFHWTWKFSCEFLLLFHNTFCTLSLFTFSPRLFLQRNFRFMFKCIVKIPLHHPPYQLTFTLHFRFSIHIIHSILFSLSSRLLSIPYAKELLFICFAPVNFILNCRLQQLKLIFNQCRFF